MTNSELAKSVTSLDKKGYVRYLRQESIKGILDSSYKPDKSFDSYKRSVFYESYISYTEYLAESLDKNIDYTNYISEQCFNVSYSEYYSEKIN